MLRLSYIALAFLFLVSSLVSQCTDGCLRCDKLDENSAICDICDSPGFYVPFGTGLCLKLEIENCEVPTVDRSVSKCVRCVKEHIFDTTTNQCKKVANLIENCERYDSSADCQECAPGFYLTAATCTAVPTDNLITNCLGYNSDATACLYCNSGFYLNQKTSTCDAVTAVDNCMAYTQNECLACSSGYLKNDNYKLSLSYDSAFMQQVVFAQVNESEGNVMVVNASLNNCQKTSVLNCDTFETFDKCTVCSSGYFLAEAGTQCILLPQEPIKNCLTYSDATTCLTCVNATYKSGSDCLASTVVSDCESYSQTSDACVTCSYGFYLSGSTCTARVNTLDSNQCQTLDPNDDKCSSCNPNFMLNNAETACLAIIENCLTNVIDSSDNITCTACEPNYGMSVNTQCDLQDIDNCLAYDSQALTCMTCENDYYLTNSGTECLLNTVKNCTTKSTSANECVTCKDYFFLDTANGNLCALQNVANCQVFTDNTNTCTTCVDGFFLDGSVCTQYTLAHCTDKNPTSNVCDVCDTDYYPDTTVPEGCSRQNVVDCISYTTATNDCTACKTDYYLNSTDPSDIKCEVKSKPNCKIYTTIYTENLCATCNTGFYVDTVTNVGDCVAQTMPGCVNHTANLNECTDCDSLYFKNTSNICQPIADVTNCVSSNGVDDECEICQPTFYLAGATPVCTLRTVGVPNVDPLCTGNKDTTDTAICTECANGYMQFHMSAFEIASGSTFITGVTTDNCKTFDTTADACLQCKEGFSSSSTSLLCDTPRVAEDCLVNKPSGVAQLLSVNTDCEKCTDDFYSASGECTARTANSMNCEPGQYNDEADKCDYCKENTVYSDPTDFGVCMKSPAGFTAVASCSVHDIDNTAQCYSCSTSNSTAPASCAAAVATGYIYNVLEADATLTSIKESTPDETTGCDSIYGLNSNETISCAKCDADTYKLIVSYDGSAVVINGSTYISDQILGTDFIAGSAPVFNQKIVPFANIPATSLGCQTLSLPHAKFLQDSDGGTPAVPASLSNPSGTPAVPAAATPITFIAEGKIKYMIELADTMHPIACDEDHFPEFFTASFDQAGTAITPGTSVFELVLNKCTQYVPADMTFNKRFEGLGYRSVSQIPLTALVHYDACIQETDFFLFIGQIITANSELGTSGNFLLYADLPGTAGNHFCMPKVDSAGDPQPLTANCQIHLSDDDGISNLITTKPSTPYKCISCKPGYKPTFDADGINITTCTLIPNCDISNDSTNTWMNMCETCKPNFSWDIAVDTLDLKLDSCLANSTENCAVINTTTTDGCMICEKGYDISSSTPRTCTKIEIENCATYNFHSLSHLMEGTFGTTSVDKMNRVNLNAYLQWAVYGNVPEKGSGCLTCDASFLSVSRLSASTVTDLFCLGSTTHTDQIDNCELYSTDFVSTTHGLKCHKCKDGMIAVQDTTTVTNNDSCVAKAVTGEENFCNAKTDTGTLGANCVICTDLNEPVSNVCYEYKNCAEIDDVGADKKCKRCDVGYKPMTDEYNCEPIPETDVCEEYMIGSICIKCKDNLSPVTLLDGSTIRVNCIDRYEGIGDARFQNSVFVIDSASTGADNTKFYSDTVYTAIGDTNVSKFMASADNPPSVICMKELLVNNCKTYDTDNFRKCTVCESGYMLNSTDFTCLDGNIPYCTIYAANGDCTECLSNYYLSAPTTCTLRNITNCATSTINADTCDSCHPNQWQASSGSLCNDYTVENCDGYTPTADTCVACIPNVHYFDNSTNCILFTKQYCKTFSVTEDKCIDCNSDRWLNGTTFECDLYTVNNCDTYSVTADQCTACKTGYFADTVNPNDCVAPTAVFCNTRETASDKCATCLTGYWKLTADKDCQLNTAVNCRDKSDSVNECTSCLAGHYMDAADSNICKPHDISFCNVYTPTANTCDTCNDNYFKNSSQLCEINTSINCETKSTIEDKCITCLENFYLDTAGKCQNVTNTTCLTVVSNENNCDTCLSTKYLDASSGECMDLTIVENCLSYSLSQDLCNSCKNGFYISSDSLSCFPNPNGIVGCISYVDLTTCSFCRDTHYLSSNTCVELTQPVVADCSAYSGDGICSACNTGFSFNAGVCEANVATGCVTWADKDNCATCLPNEILDSGSCTSTSISSCSITSGSVGSETCLACDSGSFLDNNTCTSSSTTITDCVTYSADGVCGMCIAGKVTSGDGATCENINNNVFGPNCSVGSSNSPPVCALCGNGYVMDDDGKCTVSCSASDCLLCDPNDNSKCNLCKSGFHMNSELTCIDNNAVEETDETDSIKILTGIFTLVTFFLLNWK